MCDIVFVDKSMAGRIACNVEREKMKSTEEIWPHTFASIMAIISVHQHEYVVSDIPAPISSW